MANVIDATLRLIDKFSKPMSNALGTLQKNAKQFKRAGIEIKGAGKNIEKTGAGLTKAVTVPIAGLGIGAMKTAAEFEAGMSKVKSISNASEKGIGLLTEKAKEMGAKTKFSARQSADAFSYMAMAGWKTKDMLAGIEGVMYLAGASGEDLAMTSDIVTDALTAFGMKANETNRFVDVLAATANNTNTNVAMMGETFKYVAPISGAMGYTVEDTAVAIGLMANNGIKASQAGTSLRSVISRMAKPTKDVAISMKQLGINLTDGDGKMKPFQQTLIDLRKGFSGLTEEQKVQHAAAIAGKTGMSGLLAIVNASESDFNKATKAINGSAGAAKKMYDVANDNLIGRLTILSSTIESIGISIGEKLIPYAEKGVAKIQSIADAFGKLSPKTQDQVIKFALIAAAVGPFLLVIGKTVKLVGSAAITIGNFGIKLKKAGSIMAMLTSPAGIVVAAVTGIALAAVLLIKNWKHVKSFFTRIGDFFKDCFKNAGIPVEDFKALFKSIGNHIKTILGQIKKEFSKVSTPIKKVGDTLKKALSPVITKTIQGIYYALKKFNTFLSKMISKIPNAIKNLPKTFSKAFESMGGSTDKFKEGFQKAFEHFANIGVGIKDIIAGIKNFFTSHTDNIIQGIEHVKNTFTMSFEMAKGCLAGFLNSAQEIIGGIITAFDGIVTFVAGAFTGDWEKAWGGVKNIFKGICDSLVGIMKAPLNGVIGLINGAISGINKISVDIPDWVPGVGGEHFGVNLQKIPFLYKGTSNWAGGPAMVHDRGAEIIDLPRGSRVYPHDKSIQMARKEGKGGNTYRIQIYANNMPTNDKAKVKKWFKECLEEMIDQVEQTSDNYVME